jgi:hypothetical protein
MSLSRNANVTSSPRPVKVLATAGLVFSGIDLTNYGNSVATASPLRAPASPTTCCGIELLTAGTLSFKDPWGNVTTFTNMTAGYKPIEASTIETGTTVDVIVYF